MHSSSNRSILIISGLLTLLALSGGALALGFHNDWLRSGSAAASPEAVVHPQPDDARTDGAAPMGNNRSAVGSTQTATQDEVGVYRQKLQEAYRASTMPMRRSARCSRRSPSSPPRAMTMTGSTMAMTIAVDADLTDTVHTTTDQRQAAMPWRDHVR